MSYTVEDVRNLIRDVELGRDIEISDNGILNLFKLERFLVDQAIEFDMERKERKLGKVMYTSGYADGYSDCKPACVNAIESL